MLLFSQKSAFVLFLVSFLLRSNAVLLKIFGNSKCVNESAIYGPMYTDLCLQNAEGINLAMTSCNSITKEVTGAAFTDDLCTSEPTLLGPVTTTSCIPFSLPGGLSPNIPGLPGCDLSKDCKPYIQLLDGPSFSCKAPNKFYSLQLWDLSNTACAGDPTDWVTLDGNYCAQNGLPETVSSLLPANLRTTIVILGSTVTVNFFTDSNCLSPLPFPPSLAFSKLGSCSAFAPVSGFPIQFGMKLLESPVFPPIVSPTPSSKPSPSQSPSQDKVTPSPSSSTNATKPANTDPIVNAGNGNGVTVNDFRNLVGIVSGSIVIFAIAGCACMYFISKGRSSNILSSVSSQEMAEFNRWKKENKGGQGSVGGGSGGGGVERGGGQPKFYPVSEVPMTRDQKFHSILHLNTTNNAASTNNSFETNYAVSTKNSFEPSPLS